MLRDHRQLRSAVLDSLRQNREQRLERTRLMAHRDDGTGEPFGFPASRTAEHQPDEAEQAKRTRRNRNPLRKRWRRNLLAGQRPTGTPRAERKPQDGQDNEDGSQHVASTRAAFFGPALAPLLLVERGLSTHQSDVEVERLFLVDGRHERFGALCEWVHINRQFTIFDDGRKRLDSALLGRRGEGERVWLSAL